MQILVISKDEHYVRTRSEPWLAKWCLVKPAGIAHAKQAQQEDSCRSCQHGEVTAELYRGNQGSTQKHEFCCSIKMRKAEIRLLHY